VLRIRDVYPGSRFVVKPFYVDKMKNFKKLKNYFSFKKLKKKSWANFQRIIALFTPKIVRKKPIPDPRSRGQKGTG
jgi:hypothetical protein